jgi:hypothetical protein
MSVTDIERWLAPVLGYEPEPAPPEAEELATLPQ